MINIIFLNKKNNKFLNIKEIYLKNIKKNEFIVFL